MTAREPLLQNFWNIKKFKNKVLVRLFRIDEDISSGLLLLIKKKINFFLQINIFYSKKNGYIYIYIFLVDFLLVLDFSKTKNMKINGLLC